MGPHRRGVAGLLAFVLLAPAGPASARPDPAPASGAPVVQARCPVVANVDLRRLERLARGGRAQALAAGPQPDLADVVVPATAQRRPPPDASFVVRVRLPSGGGYARDERAVVWREADGSWWGWRTVVAGDPPSPPEPPAPGSPEEAQRVRDAAEGYPWTYDSTPTFEGRLDPAQSARMEAAWADPCRRLEPDLWPSPIPLLRAEEGRRARPCRIFQDATFYVAEFTENGGPPRRVALPCGAPGGSLNGTLVTGAAHVELPALPLRRLTREEIDARRAR